MSHRAEHGQMIMMLALAFALFLFATVALVADSAYLYVWSARVQAAAQVAAQAGANSVDPHYLYGQSNHLIDLAASGSLMTFERRCVQVGDESAQLTDGSGTAQTADSRNRRATASAASATDAWCTRWWRRRFSCRFRCSATP